MSETERDRWAKKDRERDRKEKRKTSERERADVSEEKRDKMRVKTERVQVRKMRGERQVGRW